MDRLKDAINPFWFETLSMSPTASNYFVKVGRLLYICQRFETNCRRIAENIQFRSIRDIFETYDSYSRFLKKIETSTLHSHIQTIQKLPTIGDPIEILTKAKESRNYIAHELTRGLEKKLDSLADEKLVNSDLLKHSTIISNGEFISMALLSPLTREPMPNFSRITQTVEWIHRTV